MRIMSKDAPNRHKYEFDCQSCNVQFECDDFDDVKRSPNGGRDCWFYDCPKCGGLVATYARYEIPGDGLE